MPERKTRKVSKRDAHDFLSKAEQFLRRSWGLGEFGSWKSRIVLPTALRGNLTSRKRRRHGPFHLRGEFKSQVLPGSYIASVDSSEYFVSRTGLELSALISVEAMLGPFRGREIHGLLENPASLFRHVCIQATLSAAFSLFPPWRVGVALPQLRQQVRIRCKVARLPGYCACRRKRPGFYRGACLRDMRDTLFKR